MKVAEAPAVPLARNDQRQEDEPDDDAQQHRPGEATLAPGDGYGSGEQRQHREILPRGEAHQVQDHERERGRIVIDDQRKQLFGEDIVL